MAQQNGTGVDFKKNLRVGVDELSWLQEEDRRRAAMVFRALFRAPGLLFDLRGGLPGPQWRVHDDDDDGTVTIEAGLDGLAHAIGADGELVEYEPGRQGVDTEVALTNDNTWYTLVLKTDETQLYEPGTLTVTTGSATVNGTGTEFTRYAGYTTDGYQRGSRIRIDETDSSNGNEGTYEINTVVSDTQITLTEAVGGTNEAGMPFTIAGNYAATAPSPPDIHKFRKPAFEVVARKRVAGADEIILFDVKRNDAGSPKVSLIDRRSCSRARRRPQDLGAARVSVRLDYTHAEDVTIVNRWQRTVLTGTAEGNARFAVAPAWIDNRTNPPRDGLLFAYEETSTSPDTIATKRWLHTTDGPDTAVTVVQSDSLCVCDLLQLPAGAPYTHLLFLNDTANGDVTLYTSADNGSTWSSAGAIWQPASDTAAGEARAILLRNHRIILIAPIVTVPRTVNYVYSDDYGATWSTNSNAGWPIISDGSTSYFRPGVCQTEDGRIWTFCSESGDEEVHFVVSEGEDLPDPASTTPVQVTMGDGTSDIAEVGAVGLLDQVLLVASVNEVAVDRMFYGILGLDGDDTPYMLDHVVALWRAGNDGSFRLCPTPRGGVAIMCRDASSDLQLCWLDTVQTLAPVTSVLTAKLD